MSLIRRGKQGLFSLVLDDYSTGRRRRRFVALGTTSKKEAEQKRAQTLADMSRGLYPGNAVRMTVGEWLEEWLAGRSVAGRAPKTLISYRSLLRTHLVPAIGHIRLVDLTPGQIEHFYASLPSRSLASHCHSVLGASLRAAVRRGLLARNPVDSAAKPRTQWHEQKVLSRTEVQALLNTVREHRLYPLFFLALSTGMRQGELLGLRWEDVDFDHGAISVQVQRQYLPGQGVVERPTKEHRGVRHIEMTTAEREILHRQAACLEAERTAAGPLWQEHGLVFPSACGTPMNARNLVRVFKNALLRAGLADVHFHTLRHTAGTHLAHDSGGNLNAVQERLGHADVATTLRMYGHALKGSQEAIAERTMRSLLGEEDATRTDEGRREQ